MKELYYYAPTESAFADMKKCAIAVWLSYDDTYGYATDKVNRVKDIQNVSDNFMYIFAMFDQDNQRKCAHLMQQETKQAVYDRLLDGGCSIEEASYILDL